MGTKKGSLTVFLSLILFVLFGLFFVLFELVKNEGCELETRIAVDAASDSVLADYNQQLFAQFDILALDSSYGTDYCSLTNVTKKFTKYLEKNFPTKNGLTWDPYKLRVSHAEVTSGTLLVDAMGYVFEEAVSQAQKDETGIAYVEEFAGWLSAAGIEDGMGADTSERRSQIVQEIESYELEDLSVNGFDENVATGVLLLAGENISGKRVNSGNLLSTRIANGAASLGEAGEHKSNPVNSLLFNEYILSHLRSYTNQVKESALDYEIEYVLCGKESDEDNLKECIYKLLLLREALNAVSIHKDESKMAEITAISDSLATLCLSPEVSPLLKELFVLWWAYTESKEDVRRLLAGEKVRFSKQPEDWSTTLMGGLKQSEVEEASDKFDMLDYEGYLRILLTLAPDKNVRLRTMDVVELRIRSTDKNPNFRLDGCFVEIEAEALVASGKKMYQCVTRKKY